jgi:hypothetical protein
MAAIISPRFTPAPPSRLDLSRGGKGEWPRRPFVDRPAPFCYDAPIDARPRALRGRRKTHNSEAKEPAVRMRALVLATLLIAALVAADHLRAQAPSSGSAAPAGASAPVPRTPWGHPDLQGTWDYRTITPLERPAQYGDRQYLTDEEVKALEERAAKRMDEPPSDEAPNQAGTIHATYWTDPGRRVDDDRRTSLIIDPPDGRIPALVNPGAGRGGRGGRGGGGAARPGGRADSWLDRTLLERCITWGLPTASLPGLYNNNIQIVQSPDHVVIVHEMVHDARVIPLDGRPRVTGKGSATRNYLGESRGWFDGDTLVVETTNFGPRTSYRGANVNLTLTERYRRINADRVELLLTVDDPTVWTKPWTVKLGMRPTEGDLVEYACHEGNYGLRNILEVARDEEKAAAAAGQK